MGKRSRWEIKLELLELVGRGVSKPTHLMYGANLSWVSLSEILRDLEVAGLVRNTIVDGHRRFYLTDKGRRALELSRELRAVVEAQK